MSLKLRSVAGEVEHLPWDVVNNLMRVSPYMLQRVGIALQLWIETGLNWGTTYPLAPGKYEGYFRQVRSALPELDKKVITSISIAVRHSSRLVANLIYGRLAQCRIFLMWRYVVQMKLNNKGTINFVPGILAGSKLVRRR